MGYDEIVEVARGLKAIIEHIKQVRHCVRI